MNTRRALNFALIAVAAVVIWWMVTEHLILCRAESLDESRRLAAGQYGDSFGAVNSLFSGLAFAGVVWALILQKNAQVNAEAERHLTLAQLKETAAANEESARLNEQAHRASIRPIIVFYRRGTGWAMKNVGSGPALTITFQDFDFVDERTYQVLLFPMGSKEEKIVDWAVAAGKFEVFYEDLEGRPFQTTCLGHDNTPKAIETMPTMIHGGNEADLRAGDRARFKFEKQPEKWVPRDAT